MFSRRNDRGQSTLWLLVVSVVVVLCSVGVARLGGQSVHNAQHRSAADLVALAAAAGDETAATEVAVANRVTLVSLEWLDSERVVVVVVSEDGDTVTATAEVTVEIGE